MCVAAWNDEDQLGLIHLPLPSSCERNAPRKSMRNDAHGTQGQIIREGEQSSGREGPRGEECSPRCLESWRNRENRETASPLPDFALDWRRSDGNCLAGPVDLGLALTAAMAANWADAMCSKPSRGVER